MRVESAAIAGIRFATVYLSDEGRPFTLLPVVVLETFNVVLGFNWKVRFQTTWIRPPVRLLAATSALVTRVMMNVELVVEPADGVLVSDQVLSELKKSVGAALPDVPLVVIVQVIVVPAGTIPVEELTPRRMRWSW